MLYSGWYSGKLVLSEIVYVILVILDYDKHDVTKQNTHKNTANIFVLLILLLLRSWNQNDKSETPLPSRRLMHWR